MLSPVASASSMPSTSMVTVGSECFLSRSIAQRFSSAAVSMLLSVSTLLITPYSAVFCSRYFQASVRSFAPIG